MNSHLSHYSYKRKYPQDQEHEDEVITQMIIKYKLVISLNFVDQLTGRDVKVVRCSFVNMSGGKNDQGLRIPGALNT